MVPRSCVSNSSPGVLPPRSRLLTRGRYLLSDQAFRRKPVGQSRRTEVPVLALFIALASAGAATELDHGLTQGTAALASAGPLTFGPDGILFVADTRGAALWALDTGDRKPGGGAINVSGLQDKLAAMLGVAADQVAINDMIVNPISRKAY